MPKKYELITVLSNGKFCYKTTPAKVRKMLKKKEVRVVNVDPFIVKKVNKKIYKNKSFK